MDRPEAPMPAVQVIHRLTSFLEDAYENVEWDMAVNGETALIRRLTPARLTTAFDVGAHIGDWSIAALSVWPACRVHAFEVAPATFEGAKHRVLLADYYEMLGARYWIGKVYPTHVEFSDYDWTMESFRSANFLCVARSRPDLKSLAEGS